VPCICIKDFQSIPKASPNLLTSKWWKAWGNNLYYIRTGYLRKWHCQDINLWLQIQKLCIIFLLISSTFWVGFPLWAARHKTTYLYWNNVIEILSWAGFPGDCSWTWDLNARSSCLCEHTQTQSGVSSFCYMNSANWPVSYFLSVLINILATNRWSVDYNITILSSVFTRIYECLYLLMCRQSLTK